MPPITPCPRSLRWPNLWAIGFLVTLCGMPAGWAEGTNDSSSIQHLTQLARPARLVPFREVVYATTQHRILDFDTNTPAHFRLFQKLTQAAASAATNAQAAGLFTTRANEAGNAMESFVRAALRDTGLDARTPSTTRGRTQTAGYPDVELLGEVPCYLELKTYSATTANTTQRSFYYSPSENSKVTRDAVHLLLAYQLERSERKGQTVFLPVHWKLVTLQDLEVNLKLEFNQSNRGLYGQDAKRALLGESQAQ